MEEPHLTKFQQRVAALSERTWRIIQIVGGAALGCATAYLVAGTPAEESGMNLIFAAVLALILPRSVEQSCKRSFQTGRAALIASLAAGIALKVLLNLT